MLNEKAISKRPLHVLVLQCTCFLNWDPISKLGFCLLSFFFFRELQSSFYEMHYVQYTMQQRLTSSIQHTISNSHNPICWNRSLWGQFCYLRTVKLWFWERYLNPLNPKIEIWILICYPYSFPTEVLGSSSSIKQIYLVWSCL